ncbi:sugar phosphate isomerase/epimerase family protein [Thermoanaerobacter indiensis]|uniref:sugar phosphate isomerase/epimerase family protein n=1 Tax=Thermoanaerobacter indiensis TaxID=1125974 RepID=UPI00036D268F|nr:sugar phosphate isomerase/epimerase family protein [Thermoanaerobacter indiensis]
MKKGINIWSFKRGMRIEDCIKIAKDAGYDGIELRLDEEAEINLNSDENDILRIKKIAEDEGIEIPSISSSLYWIYPFTSSDPNIRQKAKDIVKKQLEIAKLLGADTVLVVPGVVHADFIPGCEIVDYDVAYERALEAFSELKEYAEELKIHIGLENVWNKFLLSPLEFRDFIDKINSPYVGVYLDVGNVVYIGYPEQWIKILGNRINKVHFKDFKRAVGTVNGFVDLLAGDVNFPAVMEAFKSIGYEDYAIAEMAPYTYYENQVIYNASKAMDQILGR